MNIIEAVRSGKKFKRKGGFEYFDYSTHEEFIIKKEAILATDWEVEENKVEVTRTKFEKVWNIVRLNDNFYMQTTTQSKMFKEFCKELGLEEGEDL